MPAKTPWCLVANGGMDPYIVVPIYNIIPNNNPHTPFPTKNQTVKLTCPARVTRLLQGRQIETYIDALLPLYLVAFTCEGFGSSCVQDGSSAGRPDARAALRSLPPRYVPCGYSAAK